MSEVSTQAAAAFFNERDWQQSNTEVKVKRHESGKHEVAMFLHGNLIAIRTVGNSIMYVSNCGHFTRVTKDRLNALRKVNVTQKNKKWFLNGHIWDGEMTGVVM